jgi:hypothetical protein
MPVFLAGCSHFSLIWFNKFRRLRHLKKKYQIPELSAYTEIFFGFLII